MGFNSGFKGLITIVLWVVSLCDGLITRPEESYRLWCVVVCDLETSWMRRPWPTGELLRPKQTNKQASDQCLLVAQNVLSQRLTKTGKLRNGLSVITIRLPKLYESVEITDKMQLCNRIYYSKVYWRLNMFRAADRSSSGALNCICSLWFVYPCGDRPLSRLSLDNGRSPHVYINQRLQVQFRAPDDERCAARNMLSLQWTLE